MYTTNHSPVTMSVCTATSIAFTTTITNMPNMGMSAPTPMSSPANTGEGKPNMAMPTEVSVPSMQASVSIPVIYPRNIVCASEQRLSTRSDQSPGSAARHSLCHCLPMRSLPESMYALSTTPMNISNSRPVMSLVVDTSCGMDDVVHSSTFSAIEFQSNCR